MRDPAKHYARMGVASAACRGMENREEGMNSLRLTLMLAAALCASLAASAALAAEDKVVIGDIDDMSGPYADVIGPAGIEAIKMAIADFGGTVLGKPIDLLTFDHQNKPALASQKLREWADTDGLNMLLGGSNTGVSLAMAPVSKEKKIPFFAIAAAGASLTGKDCTPYMVHYGYDTTALANGTAKTLLERGGKSWFFLTADYAFGKQLEAGATEVINAGGGKVAGRCSGAARDVGLLLLSAAGARLGRASARPRQRRHGHVQLDEGGVGIRPHQNDDARRLAGFPLRRSRDGASDRPGSGADHRLVLGPR